MLGVITYRIFTRWTPGMVPGDCNIVLAGRAPGGAGTGPPGPVILECLLSMTVCLGQGLLTKTHWCTGRMFFELSRLQNSGLNACGGHEKHMQEKTHRFGGEMGGFLRYPEISVCEYECSQFIKAMVTLYIC